MRVCVTGGTGFVGARLVTALRVRDMDVVVTTRRHDASTSGAEKFVVDLTDDTASLTGLFTGVSVVFHCAGEIKREQSMRQLHVLGTGRLLAAVRARLLQEQTPLHWVQLSSVGAYGSTRKPCEVREINETTASAPKGEYEITKTLADEMLVAFAETEPLFSYTIVRPTNIIAEDMPNRSLRQLIGAVRRGHFFYIGNTPSISTYVHVEDVVAALVLCGFVPGSRNQTFIVSNDCPLSDVIDSITSASERAPIRRRLPEWVVRVAACLMSRLPRFPLTAERINALVSRTSYSNGKIRAIGFCPVHAIPETIGRFANAWLKR